MLKIIDNIDLEEEFIYKRRFEDYEITFNKEETLGTYININPKTRIISYHYHFKNLEKEDMCEMNILFDLIQAGLVEKVDR